MSMKSIKKQVKYCEKLKIITKKKYSLIGSIYCPILDKYIVFNSVGIRHLQYKSNRTPRTIQETIYKMRLFPFVVSVIKKSKHISSIRKIKIKIKDKMKDAVTYSIVYKTGYKKQISVRVIILKVGNGNYKFYSVMKDK